MISAEHHSNTRTYAGNAQNYSMRRSTRISVQRRQVYCVDSESICLARFTQILQGSGLTLRCWTDMARGDQRGSPWRSSVSQMEAHLYQPGGLLTWHSMDRGTLGGEKKKLKKSIKFWNVQKRDRHICVCVCVCVRTENLTAQWCISRSDSGSGVSRLDCGQT